MTSFALNLSVCGQLLEALDEIVYHQILQNISNQPKYI
jgi:hypothetical protein